VSRALIAGGAGFIGTHLARHLADAGYEVDLVDDLSRGQVDEDLRELMDRPGVRLLERDLLDASSLEGEARDYELIFNLAAIVGVRTVSERPYAVLRDNVELATNMLRFAARQESLARFVFASTSEVYAGTLEAFDLPVPTPESVPLTVPDLRRPRTTYLLSKMYGEALCRHSGVPFTIVRPHNVYGPRMGLAHVIPELLQRAESAPEGGRLEVYSVEHRRTFCYVADAVEMLRLAAEAPECAGEELNLGRQAPEVRIREVAELVVKAVGKELEIVPGPVTPGSPERRAPDTAKLTRLTGYEAQVGLEDGIARTYEWYRRKVFATVGSDA
jgi:UDP-glucose 4-epimerase